MAIMSIIMMFMALLFFRRNRLLLIPLGMVLVLAIMKLILSKLDMNLVINFLLIMEL
nr:MAG TPA: hypothetical protein [Caudoviricetes sp.]